MARRCARESRRWAWSQASAMQARPTPSLHAHSPTAIGVGTGRRSNLFHSAGIDSAAEALTAHMWSNHCLEWTSADGAEHDTIVNNRAAMLPGDRVGTADEVVQDPHAVDTSPTAGRQACLAVRTQTRRLEISRRGGMPLDPGGVCHTASVSALNQTLLGRCPYRP
jgi:hypothetical protein